jgi:hypothetical protein
MIRARLEFALAAVFAVLAILTALIPDWIEVVFRIEPDAGSSALEWVVVLAFGALALSAALLGRRHYRAAAARE